MSLLPASFVQRVHAQKSACMPSVECLLFYLQQTMPLPESFHQGCNGFESSLIPWNPVWTQVPLLSQNQHRLPAHHLPQNQHHLWPLQVQPVVMMNLAGRELAVLMNLVGVGLVVKDENILGAELLVKDKNPVEVELAVNDQNLDGAELAVKDESLVQVELVVRVGPEKEADRSCNTR